MALKLNGVLLKERVVLRDVSSVCRGSVPLEVNYAKHVDGLSPGIAVHVDQSFLWSLRSADWVCFQISRSRPPLLIST